MTSHNATNERIKRRYLAYLKEAKRHSEATVDAAAKALSRFEEFTGYRDFKAFHVQQAVAFKRRLSSDSPANRTKALSKATLHATFAHLKTFFTWLAGQPGYRSRLRYSDAEYFNLSEKDTRIATAHREKLFPTLEQVKHVIGTMPHESEIERRNRALVAFTLLTAARDGAIASLKVKHVDLLSGSVYQDAREVKTKFSKSFRTYFFPVGDEILEIFVDWVTHLKDDLLWGNDDPLFPATRVVLGSNHQFQAAGLKPEHWSDAAAIRGIFREAFVAAGLAYFNPHSLRDTLVHLGETVCQTPEQFKAWSQNLGHEGVMTTFSSYGAVGTLRQGEIVRSLGKASQSMPPTIEECVRATIRELGLHSTLNPSSTDAPRSRPSNNPG